MTLASSMKQIQAALDASQTCSAGLTGQKGVFGIERGPSGGPEILAVLYLDDPTFDFWYGHILRHPQKPDVFVTLIVRSHEFINAGNVPLLFRRFHYWIKGRLKYSPCSAQGPHDAYAETHSQTAAASALVHMIRMFDLDNRCGLEGRPSEFDRAEMRVVEVYGLLGAVDDNGRYPPVPMPTELRLVGAPE